MALNLRGRFLSWLERARVSPGIPVSRDNPYLGTTSDAAGVSVTPITALTAPAVWACVNVIVQTMAHMPLHLLRQVGKSKEPATDHPLYHVLLKEPNPEQTSFEWREMSQTNILTRGVAYSEIERDQFGRIVGLWPIWPPRVRLEKKSGRLIYWVTVNGKEFALLPEQVLHIKGFSERGLLGYVLTDVHKSTIGASINMADSNAKFFENDATPSGTLEHPGVLGVEAREHLEQSWESAHKGLSNRHRVAILEEGMTFKAKGLTPIESDLVKSRTFNILDIARLFRMQPHKIQEMSNATFSNIGDQNIEHGTDTILPWVVRWEQRLDKQLLTPEEKGTLFAKYAMEGILRGDPKSRAEFYSKLFMNAAITPNEIRQKEDMNPYEGGDTYYIPVNMIPTDATDTLLPPEPAGSNSRRADSRASQALRLGLRRTHRRLFLDTGNRIVRAEIREIRKELKQQRARRDVQGFRDWLEDFYDEARDTFVATTARPAWDALGQTTAQAAASEIEAELDQDAVDATITANAEGFASRHNSQSRNQLDALARDEEEPFEAIEERLDEWDDKRADKIADNETVRLSENIAKAVFLLAGITTYRWNTSSGACPLCQELDGKVVGRDVAFVAIGDTVDPNDGQTNPLTSTGDIGHAPLHQGCNCFVTAG